MHFQIADNEGSVLDTFDNGREAVAALRSMLADDPAAANDLLLLSFDDSGDPAGPASTLNDLLAALPWLQVEMPWTQKRSSTSANPATSAHLHRRSRAFRAKGSSGSRSSKQPALV